MSNLKIAIVGAGPSGCYVAEQLVKHRGKGVQVDVFDRLPTPFGLVRAGVAPDHQKTKRVERVLGRAIENDNVHFYGNIEIGRDLSVEKFRSAYDAVVLAVGTPRDRALGIPGEDLKGVIGSAAFVGWYNGHPDFADLDIAFESIESGVIIGNGNVALDVVRVLVRAGAEMDASDLDPDVEAKIIRAPLRHLLIAGRRDVTAIKFTPVELAELGTLKRATVTVDRDIVDVTVAGKDPSVDVLRTLADKGSADNGIPIVFGFQMKPLAFIDRGDGRVGAVRFRKTRLEGDRFVDDDETFDVAADLVVTCIGYEAVPCGEILPNGGFFANEDGKITDGLYVAGWAGHGPTGVIPTTRLEARALASKILNEVAPQGAPGWTALGEEVQHLQVVRFDGWKRIDAFEVSRADADRVRRKFRRIGELLDIGAS